MTVVLFLGSLQLLVVGVLGEYISKIYTQIQNRPIYNLIEEQKQ
jgi:dolichol-phosphate mannosyltransferase